MFPNGKSLTIDSIEEKVLSAKQKLTRFSLIKNKKFNNKKIEKF